MRQTFTQKVHYRIVIEGEYNCANQFEEELAQTPEEYHDLVWEHLGNHFSDYYLKAKIECDNLITIKE